MRLFYKIFFLIVIIFSSIILAQEPEFIGTIRIGNANTLFGYRILPLGDQNGDGFDDIMIFELRASPTPTVFKSHFFYGGDTTSSIPYLTINETNSASNNIGDVNSDGFDDFLIQGRFDEAFKLGLYYGGPLLDSLRDYWFGLDTIYARGFAVRGFDINQNGTDEIISREKELGSLVLFEIGAAYDTIPDMVLKPPNLSLSEYENMGWDIASGDFNGDGYDDFYAGANPSEDTTGFIYFGGPSIDTIPDIRIPEKSAHVKLAGDINNDGYNDMITSYPLPFSGSGRVSIYYGGPQADSIADIVYYNWLDPRLQTQFGQDCAGIGDFNGDGVDDFAYSFQTSGGVGEVYVYSGVLSTDINLQYEPNLPDNFLLDQNYPNPFNPSTTIEFQLSQRDYVTLKIYNSLGQEVRTLLNKELSAGSYKLEWDGKNEGGEDVSSGVYLYKLETTKRILSKKMLLLK